MLLNVVAQQGQELVGDIERAFGQTCPEVEILRGFLILERDVADDAEADERRYQAAKTAVHGKRGSA